MRFDGFVVSMFVKYDIEILIPQLDGHKHATDGCYIGYTIGVVYGDHRRLRMCGRDQNYLNDGTWRISMMYGESMIRQLNTITPGIFSTGSPIMYGLPSQNFS